VGGVFINLKVVDTDICSETISSDIGWGWCTWEMEMLCCTDMEIKLILRYNKT